MGLRGLWSAFSTNPRGPPSWTGRDEQSFLVMHFACGLAHDRWLGDIETFRPERRLLSEGRNGRGARLFGPYVTVYDASRVEDEVDAPYPGTSLR